MRKVLFFFAVLVVCACEERATSTEIFGKVVDAANARGIPDLWLHIEGFERKICVTGSDCDQRVSLDSVATDLGGNFRIILDRSDEVDYYLVTPLIQAYGQSLACAVYGGGELTGMKSNEVYISIDCQ